MSLRDFLVAVILGIVEGLTEFIPVSSTGHLLIVEQWLPRQSDLFNIVIQSGAVVAVIPLFWARCRRMLFAWRDAGGRADLAKILAAFAITGAGGLVLSHLEFASPIAWALIAGGILFILVERWLPGRTTGSDVTWSMVVAVGVAQLAAAVFPGLSRSGATILALLVMGLGRAPATEFSFLVGIPTLLAAGAFKIFKAVNGAASLEENWPMVVVGTIVSAIVSFAAVKWMLTYIRTHTFSPFGWYRIALGAIILGILWIR
jgi:undecaprenyl-diphosphatase